MPFITQMGPVKVEQHEIGRQNGMPYMRIVASGIGVLHTTEGSSIDGALAAFDKNYDPPHFLVGENRIVQCRPLSARAAALRSNNGDTANRNAQVQIEMVAYSQKDLWLPSPPTANMAVLVMAYCAKHFGIPLQTPTPDWLDDCSDMQHEKWASDNSRRQEAEDGLWPNARGWWMHMEVPFQQPTWHWDCGAIQRSQLFQMATVLLPSV